MDNRSKKVASIFMNKVATKNKVAYAVRNMKTALTLKSDNITVKDETFSQLHQVGALPMAGDLDVQGGLATLGAGIAYLLGKSRMVDEIVTQEKNPDLQQPGVGSSIILAKDPSEVKNLVEKQGKDFAETKPIKKVYINEEEYKLYFTSFLE